MTADHVQALYEVLDKFAPGTAAGVTVELALRDDSPDKGAVVAIRRSDEEVRAVPEHLMILVLRELASTAVEQTTRGFSDVRIYIRGWTIERIGHPVYARDTPGGPATSISYEPPGFRAEVRFGMMFRDSERPACITQKFIDDRERESNTAGLEFQCRQPMDQG